MILKGYPDGLDIDSDGNVWVSAPGGIYVFKWVFFGDLTFLNSPQKILLFKSGCQYLALTLNVLSKHGELLGGERFTTIATSNLLLAPDGYIYVTGNHGVYRKKIGNPLKDELWINKYELVVYYILDKGNILALQ